MLGCKTIETPMETNYKTRFSQESPLVDTGRYQRLVDKLIYLTHTRPDISFPVSVISQFMNCPNEEHLEAAYQTLRYLKSAPGKVTWRSKKQSMVARSSAEAEFRALSQGICEAISIAKHPVHHDRTKHVEIDLHFIKENLDSGNINLSHTPSHLQFRKLVKLFLLYLNGLTSVEVYRTLLRAKQPIASNVMRD
ncbi:Retrovirus-related Pol polyprotein from transposon RE1 [Senna tora]|uniref:Retrovirus-related Pol polyprotein from transposon RE1 n=1 Tax=Senna tora TaxID=362788 RepID=A0A834SQ80_9FABA|nr:Retrovirus-related Pol polyprotein from transposon RE1 [Senna tora]